MVADSDEIIELEPKPKQRNSTIFITSELGAPLAIYVGK